VQLSHGGGQYQGYHKFVSVQRPWVSDPRTLLPRHAGACQRLPVLRSSPWHWWPPRQQLASHAEPGATSVSRRLWTLASVTLSGMKQGGLQRQHDGLEVPARQHSASAPQPATSVGRLREPSSAAGLRDASGGFGPPAKGETTVAGGGSVSITELVAVVLTAYQVKEPELTGWCACSGPGQAVLCAVALRRLCRAPKFVVWARPYTAIHLFGPHQASVCPLGFARGI